MSSRTNPTMCRCQHCADLREAARVRAMRRNHPHYVENGKEQPLLAQLITSNPPLGGLEAYVADLDRNPWSDDEVV